MTLNLDPGFKPYGIADEIGYDYFTFSGGEPHIKILSSLDNTKKVGITHRIRSFNDVGLLLIAVNALRNMGIKTIDLLLPYFPATRQDRLMTKGEALSVKVYADIINSQGFDSVSIYDPHSDVAPALLNNCKVISNHKFIEQISNELSEDLLLIAPDGGALKKIHKLAAHLGKYEVIECSKTRNIQTGALSGFKVYADDLAGKTCLIVDDICDGGGTFLGISQRLQAKNAGNIYLAVSHGIFNRGLDKLANFFKKIYCTDAFSTLKNSKVLTQYQLNAKLLS